MREMGTLQKVSAALADSNYDALIISGADNVQYLTGAALPFAPYRPDQYLLLVWPKTDEPMCICPAEWAGSMQRLGWVGRMETYAAIGADPTPAAQAAGRYLGEVSGDAVLIGADLLRMTSVLFNAVQALLPTARFADCDAWLARLRMVKTPAELELLEETADKTDHGINGAIHHVVVERLKTQLTLAEDIRVHCMERGLDVRGYGAAAQVACGPAARKYWPQAPKYGYSGTEPLAEGAFVRMSMAASSGPYRSDAARMMVMGQPSAAQLAAYRKLVALREAVLAHLMPGVACCQVYREVQEEARAAGITFIADLGLGHGIGVTCHEGPYLNASDGTLLEPGMVIVIDPIVQGPDGELLRSKDTAVITEQGCRVIGWYRDWREPYVPIQAI